MVYLTDVEHEPRVTDWKEEVLLRAERGAWDHTPGPGHICCPAQKIKPELHLSGAARRGQSGLAGTHGGRGVGYGRVGPAIMPAAQQRGCPPPPRVPMRYFCRRH